MKTKASIFGGLCFSIQLVFMVTTAKIWPTFYPGETFLFVGFYIINIVAAFVFFPLFALVTDGTRLVREKPMMVYFFFMLFIINLTMLAGPRTFYPVSLLKEIFSQPEIRGRAICELINPIVSFIITVTLIKSVKTVEES